MKSATVTLIGKKLSISSPSPPTPAQGSKVITQEINLAEGKWKIEQQENQEIKLIPQEGTPHQHSVTFTFTNSNTKKSKEEEDFLKKIKRVTKDERTHGIDIQKQVIPQPQLGPDAKLELSVWDFGGQHEYYNNHHYFLSARSIFLVVWNATEGPAGVAGLEFWLKSLKAHLPAPVPGEKPSYSILVVGTHIDKLINPGDSKPTREVLLGKLFRETCQMNLPFEYIEISTSTARTNVDHLHKRIIATALGHNYMGELIPESYLQVEQEIIKMRDEFQELPMVELEKDLFPRLLSLENAADLDTEKSQRAINLLHSWGECIHFTTTPLLSKYLVLDPSFLTQKILSGLFNPDLAKYFPGGKLHHFMLQSIWVQYKDKAEFLLALLEQFEVCFELTSSAEEPDFWNRYSLITAYLPENPTYTFTTGWTPALPPNTNQLSQIYTFNIIPKELVSRLLVKLHKKMEEKALWRTGLFLESPDGSGKVKVLIQAKIEQNQLEVMIRGAKKALALSILGVVHSEIDKACKIYHGVSMQQEPIQEVDTQPKTECWEFEVDEIWETRTEGATSISIFPKIRTFLRNLNLP